MRLHERIRRCVECPLHKSRQQAVPGEGNPDARILFIGEAPGKMEKRFRFGQIRSMIRMINCLVKICRFLFQILTHGRFVQLRPRG